MFKIFELLILLFIFSVSVVFGYKDYKNFKICETLADNNVKQETLFKLSQDSAYTFFSLHRKANKPYTVLVPPEKFEDFTEILSTAEIQFKVLINNVSEVLEAEKEANKKHKVMKNFNVFDAFYTLEEINVYLESLVQQYPSRLYIKTFGKSYENRPMNILTINNGDGRLDKKVIFVDAAIHAREWIAPSLALYIIQQLVENFKENEELLRDFNWVIMPVMNVDGYVYSHEEDRYWRKTRKPNKNSDCIGTDLNRNFDYFWGLDEGSSDDPCLEIFRGDEAFSEQEARILSDIFAHYKSKMVYYLSIHSYGNMILLPWGHTNQIPDTFFNMMDVADAGAMAIVRETGTIYSYGNSYNVIYPTSGDTVDFIVGVHNISVAMTMELTAGGSWGFDPPVRQIKEFVEEAWIGVRAMAEVVVAKF